MDNQQRKITLAVKGLRQLLAEMQESNNRFIRRSKTVLNPPFFDERVSPISREEFADCKETLNKLRTLNEDMKENLLRLKQLRDKLNQSNNW